MPDEFVAGCSVGKRAAPNGKPSLHGDPLRSSVSGTRETPDARAALRTHTHRERLAGHDHRGGTPMPPPPSPSPALPRPPPHPLPRTSHDQNG